MKYLLLVFVCFCSIFLASSCSGTKNKVNRIADTYYGFLPCADCPGISYTLELDKNGQYHRTMDYYDRESTFTDTGKFTFAKNRLNLVSDGEITSRFDFEGDKLIYLDAEGKRIESNLAPYYILHRGDPSRAEMPTEFGMENFDHIYKGSGNEPFWMVQVNRDNTMTFSGLMENGEIKWEVPVTSTRLSDDGQSIVYTGKKGENSLEVRIINEPCQDNMSGFHFATTLEVAYTCGDQNAQLKGCGKFLNEYALTGIWKLVSAPGNLSVTTSGLTLGLYLPGEQFAGNAGCNRYFGTIDKVSDNYLQFSQIGITKMACPDMSLENRFIQLLNQESIQWSLSGDDELTLSKNGDHFVFERTNTL